MIIISNCNNEKWTDSVAAIESGKNIDGTEISEFKGFKSLSFQRYCIFPENPWKSWIERVGAYSEPRK